MAIEQILSFELIKIEQSQYCSVSDKTVIKQSVHMWRVNIYRREADTSGRAGLTRRLSVLVAADKVAHKLISPTPTVGSFLALLTTIDTTVASPIISNQTASHLMNLIKNLKSQKLNTVLYNSS